MTSLSCFVIFALLPGSFCFYPLNAQGTAVGTAEAARGNAVSRGDTFTDPLGVSRSMANGAAEGAFPSTTSVVNSASNGAVFPRYKRQPFYPGYPSSSAGNAVGEAGALKGDSTSHGFTVTTGGLSKSDAFSAARGLEPSSSSVANSDSRVKRHGPYPYGGHAAGTGIGTATALQGRSDSEGHSHTGGGISDSEARGSSEGLQPSATSISTSESDRRKRDYGYQGQWPGYPGVSLGNAEGRAMAEEGSSQSIGDTHTDGGLTNSDSQGVSEGIHPAANSQASSESRFKRDENAEDPDDDEPVPAGGYLQKRDAEDDQQDDQPSGDPDVPVDSQRRRRSVMVIDSGNGSVPFPSSTGAGLGNTGTVFTSHGNLPGSGGKIFLVQSDFSSSGDNASSAASASSSSH